MADQQVARAARYLMLGIVLSSLAGCSLLDSTSSAPSVTPIQNEAVQATDVDGPFRLTFDLPRATWASTEAIEGEARSS